MALDNGEPEPAYRLIPPVTDPSRLLPRICTGRFSGEKTVWLTITSSLAVFNLECTANAVGVPIEPKLEVLPGFVSHVSFYNPADYLAQTL